MLDFLPKALILGKSVDNDQENLAVIRYSNASLVTLWLKRLELGVPSVN